MFQVAVNDCTANLHVFSSWLYFWCDLKTEATTNKSDGFGIHRSLYLPLAPNPPRELSHAQWPVITWIRISLHALAGCWKECSILAKCPAIWRHIVMPAGQLSSAELQTVYCICLCPLDCSQLRQLSATWGSASDINTDRRMHANEILATTTKLLSFKVRDWKKYNK